MSRPSKLSYHQQRSKEHQVSLRFLYFRDAFEIYEIDSIVDISGLKKLQHMTLLGDFLESRNCEYAARILRAVNSDHLRNITLIFARDNDMDEWRTEIIAVTDALVEIPSIQSVNFDLHLANKATADAIKTCVEANLPKRLEINVNNKVGPPIIVGGRPRFIIFQE